jgi:small subunit ribosomal protein S8
MSMTTDPIADLLTRLRNALSAKLRFIDVPTSKMKVKIVEILKAEGFIENFLVRNEQPQGTMRIFLKYKTDRSPVLRGLKRVSRSGKRVYVACNDIPRIFGGMGTSIISTSSGVLTAQEARKANVGGEVLCHIW